MSLLPIVQNSHDALLQDDTAVELALAGGDGDIGLHDATWRSTFGGAIYRGGGSHGCINLPYWAAQSIYYNAPTGILVRVV